MTRHRSPILRVAALAFAGTMILAACGSSDGGSSSGSDSGGGELSGTSLTVGSKDFTENILLGQMLVQALESKGAKVTDQTCGCPILGRAS